MGFIEKDSRPYFESAQKDDDFNLAQAALSLSWLGTLWVIC